MKRFGKKNQKRLAKLVSMALMCAGGLCSLPSAASAEEVTVTNVTGSNPLYDVTSDPADGMTNPPGAIPGTKDKTVWYPTSANDLNITGAFDANQITFYGGYDAGVSGKTVNIKGTDTDIAVGTVAGGYANGNYSVTGNYVNFLGGTTKVGEINGGFGKNGANVSENHVNIAEGSTVKYSGYGVMILGGRGDGGVGGSVDANTVTISGTLATANPSYNLYVTVAGGGTDNGDKKNVTGNMVEIKGATFDTGANDDVAIFGGLNDGTNGTATGNTVTISGNSTFGNGTASIYGGVASTESKAYANTVTLSGSPDLSGASIYGSATDDGDAGFSVTDANKTGNVLNVSTAKQTAVNSINNFQVVNLNLPTDILNNEKFLVNSTAFDLTGSTVNVAFNGDVPTTFGDGTTINLISKVENEGTYTIAETITAKYSAEVSVNAEKSLVLTIKNGVVTWEYAYGNDLNKHDGLDHGTILTGAVSDASLEIAKGTAVTVAAYGGATKDGSVTGNTLTISGGTVGSGALGGLTHKGDAKNNHAVIKDSTLTMDEVEGGFTVDGSVDTNSVEITNSTVTLTGGDDQYIKGGFALKSGAAATGNSVTITKSKVTGVIQLDGADTRGNTVTGNTITIQAGSEVEAMGVRGARSYEDAADADVKLEKNGVTVTGSKLTSSTIRGGYFYPIYTTGNAQSTAQNNFVTIEDGSEVSTEADIIGAETYKGKAGGNTVTVTGKSTVSAEKVIGGKVGVKGGDYSKKNKVTIEDGSTVTAAYVTGGYATTGKAVVESNEVIITDSTVNGKGDTSVIAGGYTQNGSAKENHVTITNSTTPVRSVIGGRAAGAGEMSEGNTVTIEKKSNVTATVTGGSGFANAETGHNTVTISDSKVTGDVRGGFSQTGAAKENTVEMKDGTVTGSVYGGHSDSATADVKTGNTLLLSGANTVSNEVKNFETLKLAADTAWAPDTTVLSAKSFTNVDGLDISEAANLADAVTSGTMTLLNSAESSFGTGDGLKVTYDGGTATLTTSNKSVVVKDGSGSSESTQKGITFTVSATEHTVALADAGSYSTNVVNYTISGGTYSKASLGAMKWEEGGFVFAETDKITAGGLDVSFGDTFAVDGAKDQASGATLTLLDLSNTDGKIKAAVSKTVDVEAAGSVADALTFDAKRKDTAATDADLKKVVYTVGQMSTVSKATFDGAVNWNDASAYFDAAKYAFGATDIDASGLTFASTSENPMGKSMTLMTNATGLTAGTITQPNDNTLKIKDYKDGNTTYDATANGKVAVVGTDVKFTIDSVAADRAALGETSWGKTADLPKDWTASAATTIDATGFAFTGEATTALAVGETAPILNAKGLTAASPVTGAAGKTVDVNYTDEQGVNFAATATGTVTTTTDKAEFVVNSVALNEVNLAGWKGKESVVPDGWTGKGVAVDTGNFDAPTGLKPGEKQNILTGASDDFFDQKKVSGDKAYKDGEAFPDETRNNVIVKGTQTGGVLAEGAELNYYAVTKDVKTVAPGAVKFEKDKVLFDGSADEYNYSDASLDIKSGPTTVAFDNPLAVAEDDSMTLLQANDSMGAPRLMAANTLLAAASNEIKSEYKDQSPDGLPGVKIFGEIVGEAFKNADKYSFDYEVASNTATNLTFGDVEWKNEGALIDHSTTLNNVVFTGAAVDTTAIKFTNLDRQEADQTMTLVSNFGESVGEISGDTYYVNTGLYGKGHAEMDGANNLIFVTDSATGASPESHNTVMGVEAGMAALSIGNDFIGSATDGLATAGNIGDDGVAAYAKLGGGVMRQKTGSHVDIHTWNAIIALGKKNEGKASSFQYGAFFEYGTGNYTTKNDDIRGDGSARYTGGGLLAKWQKADGLYVDGSLRAGTVHDDASNVLRDVKTGTPYSYDTNAGYFGAHIGVGKEIEVNGGDVVDVYTKFFYNRRNGVSFTADKDHYDLDAVTSNILRVGARYTMKRDTWNFYGGLAYEHEFDGEASGTVSGAQLRSADIGGGSLRAELGATMKPDKNSPWSLDLNVTGFAGKKQGVMGGISVEFMF